MFPAGSFDNRGGGCRSGGPVSGGVANHVGQLVTGPVGGGGGRAQAVEEAGEGVPVVKHEVAHAQEGELLQAAGARVQAKGALCDAVERIVVVALQRVLAAQGHARRCGRLDHLLQQPCARSSSTCQHFCTSSVRLHAEQRKNSMQTSFDRSLTVFVSSARTPIQ